mmetsp:Transcript_38203/g.114293  ORF Transcript_38203/g.114293 Transcript_38203/m.114293 type:complete len:234 (-) Transcript_38203:219-920(-)
MAPLYDSVLVMLRYLSSERFSSSRGRGPLNLLSSRLRNSRRERLPISLGISPCMSLNEMDSSRKLDMFPISALSVPTNPALYDAARILSPASLKISSGKRPSKALEPMRSSRRVPGADPMPSTVSRRFPDRSSTSTGDLAVLDSSSSERPWRPASLMRFPRRLTALSRGSVQRCLDTLPDRLLSSKRSPTTSSFSSHSTPCHVQTSGPTKFGTPNSDTAAASADSYHPSAVLQ